MFAKIFVGKSAVPESFPLPIRVAGRNSVSLAALNRLMALSMSRPTDMVPGRMAEVWAKLPTPFDPASVELPGDLWWAEPNKNIAAAVRYMVAEEDRVERKWIPPPVAGCVRHYLATQYGRAGRSTRPMWAQEAVTADVVGEEDAFLVSFLLTAALASGTVDKPLLQAFRDRFRHVGAPVELMLKEVISWAAWTTARAVVAWMAEHASPRAKSFV